MMLGQCTPLSFRRDGNEASSVQETGTVLGYLTLFLNLAAYYLDGPLLHALGFQVCVPPTLVLRCVCY